MGFRISGGKFYDPLTTASRVSGRTILLPRAVASQLRYTSAPLAGSLAFTSASYFGNEGTVISFEVSRTQGAAGTIAVDWAVTGLSEGAPIPSSGTITWNTAEAGNKSVSIVLGLVAATRNGTIVLSNPRSLSGGAAPTITAGSAGLTITDVPVNPGQGLATLQLTSAAPTGVYTWTFGQGFRRGDVPSSQFITSDANSTQADVRNRWPDGSVRFAILSGVSTFSSGVPKNVAIQVTSTAPSGSNVPEPTSLDVQVTLTGAGAGTYTLQSCLGVDRSTWNKSGAGRIRSIPGRVMSEFHYYRPTTDAHVAIWFYVRRYSTGATEVETVVENGWINVAGPGAKSYGVTVAVNGATTFTGSLNHFHHTRWSRVDWVSANPQITPRHDVAYYRASRLVPNYGYNSPNNQAFIDFATAINPAPFALGNYEAAPESPSTQFALGPFPHWESLYFSSGDPRAYVATVSNCRGSGRTQTHYRDETTGRPARWQDYPNMCLTTGWGPQAPPSPSGGGPGGGWIGQGWDTPHAPHVGTGAYLIEGRWTQLETMQLHASFMQLDTSADHRAVGSGGVMGILGRPPMTTRGAAWTWRQLTYAAAMSPTLLNGNPAPAADLSVQQSYASSISNTLHWLWQRYITGDIDGGVWRNGIGWIGHFDRANVGNSTHWYGMYWMHDWQVIVWALASELGIENCTNIALLPIVRNHLYQHIVKRCSVLWPYNRAAVFAGPYLNNDDPTGDAPPANPSFMTDEQALAALAATNGLTPIDVEAAGLPLKQHSNNANLTSNDSSSMITAYWAFWRAGLILAVDHGYPGSLRGLRRLESAPNYGPTTHEDGTGFHNHPIFGIVPRPPQQNYTALTPLQFNLLPGVPRYQDSPARIPGSITLGNSDPVHPWSSADMTLTGLHEDALFVQGYYLMHRGGGHNDWGGDNIPAMGPFAYFGAPRWRNLNDPTIPPAFDSPTAPNGNPSVPHSYDAIVHDRRRNQLLSLNKSHHWPNGNGAPNCDAFDANVPSPNINNEWKHKGLNPQGGRREALSCYDYIRDKVYMLVTMEVWLAPELVVLNCRTGTWSSHGGKTLPGPTLDSYPMMAFDPVTQIGCCRGTNAAIYFIDFSNGEAAAQFYVPNLTGAALPQMQSPGILFDPEDRAFILKAATAGRTYARIRMPASNFRQGGSAWPVSIITPSAGEIPGDCSPTGGYFKKWNYVPYPWRGFIGVPGALSPPIFLPKPEVDFS